MQPMRSWPREDHSEKAGAAEDRLLPAVLDFFDSHEA
jgi:hypothetical protein